MIKFAKILTGGILLLLANSVMSDELSVPAIQAIDGTRLHQLHSEETGFDYQMLVLLPVSYDESTDTAYPTMYLLDGGATFPMLAGYYRYLRFEDAMPEMIIVGLSYGTDDWREGNHRGTDYTAPTDQREHWGGAERFQRALRSEILPFIEGAYRSDPGKRNIFGQSLGGQFVLYTAMTQPELFHGHIASNPALHRNLELFLKPLRSSDEILSALFVASASGDDKIYRDPAMKWINHWSGQAATPWQLKAISVDGYGHFSLAPESFRRGVSWLATLN